MSYPSNITEEEKQAIQARRRNNTIAMSLIGVVIVALLLFSQNVSIAISFIGIIAIIIVMLFARRFLEKRAIARRLAQQEDQEE